MTQFIAFIPVKPTPKGRPRMTRHGHAFTPQKTRDAEKELRFFLKALKPPKYAGAVSLTLKFHLIRPKSSKKAYPTGRSDLDNYIKLVADAMNGILYLDDAQIVSLNAEKRYDSIEGITIISHEII